MRTRFVLLLFIWPLVSSIPASAQCTNTIAEISYDTSVTGFGSTGSSPFIFTFPKFDAELGTLLQVKVASVVTLKYNYDIENMLSARTHAIRIDRIDDISSAALVFPVSSEYTTPWYYHPLAAADGTTGSGSDFASVPPFYLRNQDTTINETLFNTADYLGIGNVSFEYSTSMFRTNSNGSKITHDAAQDQIRFVLIYTYCSNIMLASGITSFTAVKKDDEIRLHWLTTNEEGGVRYEVVRSTDGRTFTPVQEFTASPGVSGSGSYSFDYAPAAGEKGKLMFRIKQIMPNGEIKYSPLRVVDLGNAERPAGIRLLPNPSTTGEVTIVFHDSVRGDWQVDLFNAAGQLLGSRLYSNSLVAKLNNDRKLSRGVYIVRAINKKTNERFVERLIVK